jgi:hypothetical protein
MKRAQTSNPFELEGLAPGILLSGNPPVGLAHTLEPDVPDPPGCR